MTKQEKSTEQSQSIEQQAKIVKQYFSSREICDYCSVSYPTFAKVMAGQANLLHPNTLADLLPKITKLYNRILKASALH